jgi:predicted O-methyltransferase YrrM
MESLYERLEIPEEHRSTSILPEEGELIARLLRGREIGATLETGFAYGCSAAYILSATGAPHVAVDPYAASYGEIGLRNLAALGLAGRLELIRLPSDVALPRLVERGLRVDFAFIDGGHLFEQVFVDWYYVDKLLRLGGLVMFHDRWLQPVQLIASFLRNDRSDYREVETALPNLYLFEKGEGAQREWQRPVRLVAEEG